MVGKRRYKCRVFESILKRSFWQILHEWYKGESMNYYKANERFEDLKGARLAAILKRTNNQKWRKNEQNHWY